MPKPTLEEINSIKRSVTLNVKREAFNDEERTIDISFSSETMGENWYGREKLSHDEGAVDLHRLLNKAPFLFNHKLDVYVGVVEKAWIDHAEKKGRATIRYSKTEQGEEKWQDTKDGILTQISVGAEVNEYKMEKDELGEYVLVTRWTPTEISLVTAAMDQNVGIHKSLQSKPTKSKKSTTLNNPQSSTPKTMPAIDQEKADQEIKDLQRKLKDSTDNLTQRQAVQQEIMDVAEEFKAPDLALEVIRANGNVSDLQKLLLERKQTKIDHLNETQKGLSGLEEKDADQFSLSRLVRAMVSKDSKHAEAAAFELEVCRATQDQFGSTHGMAIPSQVVNRLARKSRIKRDTMGIKADAGYTGAGDTIIEDHFLGGEYVAMLANQTYGLKHSRLMPGVEGKLTIPTQTGGTTGHWLLEDGSAPESAVTFGAITAQQRTLSANGSITRSMMMQSSLAVDVILTEDIIANMSVAADTGLFYGTGADGQPLGIAGVTGVHTHTLDATITAQNILDILLKIENSNLDISNVIHLMSPTTQNALRTLILGSGAAAQLLLNKTTKQLDGTLYEVTRQIANDSIVTGNFDECVVPIYGGLEITADVPDTTTGQVVVAAFQDMDVCIRRPQAFQIATKA